jgi:ribonuclease G
MIDKVRKILGLPSRKTGNKLVLSVEKLETRVALLEGGRLEEYSVERKSSRNIVGSVYKGKVKNIEMGLKAMFVDIGFEKNAFLHFWDAIPAALDSGIEEIDRKSNKRPRKRITVKDIPSIYPVGSDVIVQVTKGPIGTKGPRVTTNLSFAGRYLVLMPFSDRSGISRKIEEPKERERLRKILRQLEIPEGVGVIIRTVGEGQRARYFVRDLRVLLDQWVKVDQAIRDNPSPCRLFEEPDLVERTVRDFLTEEINEILCDDRGATDRMTDMIGQISRRARNRVRHYDGATPIFETYGVQKQIDDAFHRQVWLKCGGYIVIDETEALVAIDVNTGRFVGKKTSGRLEDTIVKTNLEAVKEIVRQVRLRDLGGIIVLDLIDMDDKKNRLKVYQAVEQELRKDRSPSKALQVSDFGLVIITRKRVKQSLERVLTEPCPYCAGTGVIKSSATICYEILNEVKKVGPDINGHRLVLRVNPDIARALKDEESGVLKDLRQSIGKDVTIKADVQLHHEQFDVMAV